MQADYIDDVQISQNETAMRVIDSGNGGNAAAALLDLETRMRSKEKK
jgi:hypothetical protein